MRYLKEIRWRLSSDAAKAYLGVARKVLGGLLDRLSVVGTETGARSVKLPDGTTIRVRSHGGVPIAEIQAGADTRTPPESIRECSMFMESGQLDLGSTVASLSTDSAATITFNARTAHDARFNGEIRVQEINGGERYRVVPGDPLPDDGSTTVVDDVLGTTDEVLVTRAAKKTAQFLLPASCWSGLMRRFVQAKYGFPNAIYGSVSSAAPALPHLAGTLCPASSTPALQVTAYDGADVSTIEMNFRNHQTDGIADLGLMDLWFVRVLPYASRGEQRVEFRRALYTDCAEMLRQHLIKIGRAHPDFQKLSAFMLSQTFPSTTPAVTRSLPEDMLVAAVGPYGWKFSDSGRAAAIVSMTKIEDEDEYVRSADFVIHQMSFSYNTDDSLPDMQVASSDPVTGWRCGYYAHPRVFAPLHAFRREGVPGVQNWETEWAFEEPGGVEDNFPTNVFDCDYPMYCWYEGDTLVVVRRDFATTTASGEFVPGQCIDSEGPVSGVYSVAGSCPCDEHPCMSDSVSCDAATAGYVRVVRDGYYTTYSSTVAVYSAYPEYASFFDATGQSGYGWMSRETNASEHLLGADVTESISIEGICGGAGGTCYLFNCSDAPTEYTASLISTNCYPVESPPADTGSYSESSTHRVASFGSASANEAADSKFTQLIIPQYDASSVAVKRYSLEGSRGSAVWTAAAKFSYPYTGEVSSSGSIYVATGNPSCDEGFQEWDEYQNTFSGTTTTSLCMDHPCYDDCVFEEGEYECVCQWEDGVQSSQSYTRMDEHLESGILARGARLALDDIENEYTLASVGSVASTPACMVHWAPRAPSSGAKLRSVTSSSTGYVDAALVAPEPTALAAIARVWQSDGGEFASSESLQYWRLENPIEQHAGYSAKTQELFSFIGWA